MPQPLKIDWSGLRAAAVALNNVSEAARQASVDLDPEEQRRFREAVSKRAVREKWLEKARAVVMASGNTSVASTAASNELSNRVQSGAEAVANTLKDDAMATRVGLSKYTRRMAKQAETSGVLEEAPLFKAISDIHAKLNPDQGPASMRISIFAGPQAVDIPVIDV